MSQFNQVSVVKKANVYFEGQVTSRTVLFEDGSKKTLGIMLPGEYEFNTAEKEEMEVLGGKVDILIDGENNWKHFEGAGSFIVPANSSFKLKVHEAFDYCCSYLRD
jgi:uncharacterized protein YaiE (UPF0345 family)